MIEAIFILIGLLIFGFIIAVIQFFIINFLEENLNEEEKKQLDEYRRENPSIYQNTPWRNWFDPF